MRRNKRIANALKTRGITRHQLGKKLGISQSAVTQRLNKSKDVDSIQFIVAVKDLTGYDLQWLIDGTQNVEEPASNYHTINDRLTAVEIQLGNKKKE